MPLKRGKINVVWDNNYLMANEVMVAWIVEYNGAWFGRAYVSPGAEIWFNDGNGNVISYPTREAAMEAVELATGMHS
jgi:hypothetical protein